MQLARADVPIIHTRGMQPLQHLPEVLHVCGQTLRRHGGIFDHADGLCVALHPAQHTQPCLPQVPDLVDIGPVHTGAGIYEAGGLRVLLEGIGLCVNRFAAVAPKFGDQDGRGKAFYEGRVPLQLDVLETQLQNLPVHQLDRRRRVLQRNEIGLETGFQRVAMGTDHHLFLRRQRVQRDRDLGDEGQCPLAPRKQFA